MLMGLRNFAPVRQVKCQAVTAIALSSIVFYVRLTLKSQLALGIAIYLFFFFFLCVCGVCCCKRLRLELAREPIAAPVVELGQSAIAMASIVLQVITAMLFFFERIAKTQ